jgi:hypothetical protein
VIRRSAELICYRAEFVNSCRGDPNLGHSVNDTLTKDTGSLTRPRHSASARICHLVCRLDAAKLDCIAGCQGVHGLKADVEALVNVIDGKNVDASTAIGQIVAGAALRSARS